MKSIVGVVSKGIIFNKLVGTDNTQEVKEWAEALKNAIKEEYKKTGKKVNIITDLTECKLTEDVGVKQIIAEMQKENAPYIEKSAAYTPDFFLRNVANFISKISRRRNFLVFRTKEEALGWLKAAETGKSREDIIKETAHEVYVLVREYPKSTQDDVMDYVSRLHDYSKMETDEEIELYPIQQGAVIVAFNFLKENPSLQEAAALEYITKNYSDLLSKYSSE